MGGRSSRMGADKARLILGSHPLVAEIVRKMQVAAGSVALVGEPPRYADLTFECLPDLRPGFGPISGIETALASGRAGLNLITACDMPGLEISWLVDLMKAAETTDAQCLVTQDAAGRINPLCAVYKTACLPVVQQALDRGQLKLMQLVGELRAERFRVNGAIANINRPEEWLAWQQDHGFMTVAKRSNDGRR